MTDYKLVYEGSPTVYKLVQQTTAVKVIEVETQGPQGPAGATGAQGPEGPEGPEGPQGAAGSGGDATYSRSFTNQSSVLVTHNLEKYPAVTMQDSAGTEWEVDVVHNSLNDCTVSWNTTMTGVITCN